MKIRYFTETIQRILRLRLYKSNKNNFIPPLSLTLNLSDICECRCKICFKWKKKHPGLTLSQWKDVIDNLSKSLFITITGGEPFLRKDFAIIIKYLIKKINPSIINITTNGISTEKIISDIKYIKRDYKGKLRINLSLDGLEKTHNLIRGKDCFSDMIKTFDHLKKIKGIKVNFNTVISKYNYKELEKIIDYVKSLKPDDHLFEFAQKRFEYGNLNNNSFELDNKDKIRILDVIIKKNKNLIPFSINYFRKIYYKTLKKRYLDKKQKSKCYAGYAHYYIDSKGFLHLCSVKGSKILDLKKESIKNITQKNKIKKIITNCSCTMANANMINRLID